MNGDEEDGYDEGIPFENVYFAGMSSKVFF